MVFFGGMPNRISARTHEPAHPPCHLPTYTIPHNLKQPEAYCSQLQQAAPVTFTPLPALTGFATLRL